VNIHTTANQDRVLEHTPMWRRHWKRWVIALAVAALVAMLLPAAFGVIGIRDSVAADRITIATVERGTFVRDFSTDGRVVAASSPTQYAPAAGVATLRVRAGDAVERGQVLAVIDSPDLLTKLSQERATLQSSEYELQRARIDAQRAERDANESVRSAEVDRRTAQRELERSKKAYELGAYSTIQLSRAEDALEKASSQLELAESNLDEQPQRSRFDTEVRASQVLRQRLLVSDLERQVQMLTVRSPVQGRVGQVLVADRSNVAKDAPVLTVVDFTQMEVEIQVPESFARDLSVGMEASLSGSGGPWKGLVSGVSPEVVNGSVAARVKFMDPQPGDLRQSQRMSVRVEIDTRNDVLTVERGSFVEQGKGFAYRVVDGVAQRTPIRLGASSLSRVEILEGANPGEQIVVSGVEAFGDAERVIVSN
jgi:HlyD family secretion protein